MASKTEVERKLNELIQRLHRSDEGVRSLERSLPEPRVLALHVPDLEADYWTELASGRLEQVRDGVPPRADIRIRVGSDDLVDMVDGKPGSLLSAYLKGRLRVDAGVSDLIRLRRLL